MNNLNFELGKRQSVRLDIRNSRYRELDSRGLHMLHEDHNLFEYIFRTYNRRRKLKSNRSTS